MITAPTRMMHGIPTTNADQINIDLLAFFKGAASAASS